MVTLVLNWGTLACLHTSMENYVYPFYQKGEFLKKSHRKKCYEKSLFLQVSAKVTGLIAEIDSVFI